MAKVWTYGIVIIINLLLLFFAINPWIETWSEQAIMVLILEVALLVVVGLPVILFQVFVRKKTFKQSVRDSIETVMDFLAGMV